MKPLIKDTLKEDKLPTEDTPNVHTLYKITSERGQPLYKGQNAKSQWCPLFGGFHIKIRMIFAVYSMHDPADADFSSPSNKHWVCEVRCWKACQHSPMSRTNTAQMPLRSDTAPSVIISSQLKGGGSAHCKLQGLQAGRVWQHYWRMSVV